MPSKGNKTGATAAFALILLASARLTVASCHSSSSSTEPQLEAASGNGMLDENSIYWCLGRGMSELS